MLLTIPFILKLCTSTRYSAKVLFGTSTLLTSGGEYKTLLLMIMISIDVVTLTIHIVIVVHHICINRIIILTCLFSSRGHRRTNNKPNPHSGSGFEPRPHW